MRNRGLGQPIEGNVVIDLAILDVPAMAVAGVFAVADVGNHQQPRRLAADSADGALHDSLVVIRPGGRFVLGFGQAEEDDAADAERMDLGAFLHQFVDRKLVVAGHGADFAANALARARE